MKTRWLRIAPVVLALIFIGGAGAESSVAATALRTWRATLAGGSGNAVLTLVSETAGTLTVDAHRLQPSASYTVSIYSGTCGRPTVIVGLPSLRTDSAGAGRLTATVASDQSRAIWFRRTPRSLAVRVAHGSDVRCGALMYPVATRISIPALHIDLPIIAQDGHRYPLCNVAMFIQSLAQPGEPWLTFLFAHARTGMFLPLLERSRIGGGASLVGMLVNVWSSDNFRYTYRIDRVWRNRTSLPPFEVGVEQLWLQTSEGPHGTPHKLVIGTTRVSVARATATESRPTPHGVVCGP